MKIFVFAVNAQNKIKQIYEIERAWIDVRISEACEGRDIAEIKILGDLAVDKKIETLSLLITRSVLQEQLKGNIE